jgi:translation initiation factor IF-3
MRATEKFIGNGDKVKVTIRFRGREMAHVDLGRALLKRVEEDTVEIAKLETIAKMEGRQMMMILSPK